jgi:hypothetical protein
MVISDENGNPEQGIEIHDLSDFEYQVEVDEDDDPWSLGFQRRSPTFTFTLQCTTFTLYHPRPGGGWARGNGQAVAASGAGKLPVDGDRPGLPAGEHR